MSPEQIKANIEKDPVLWQAKVQALRNVGLEVLDIIKRKDTEELWDAGENLDEACEGCHIEYRYPGDKLLLEKLDRRLTELYGPRADRSVKVGMTPKRSAAAGHPPECAWRKPSRHRRRAVADTGSGLGSPFLCRGVRRGQTGEPHWYVHENRMDEPACAHSFRSEGANRDRHNLAC